MRRLFFLCTVLLGCAPSKLTTVQGEVRVEAMGATSSLRFEERTRIEAGGPGGAIRGSCLIRSGILVTLERPSPQEGRALSTFSIETPVGEAPLGRITALLGRERFGGSCVLDVASASFEGEKVRVVGRNCLISHGEEEARAFFDLRFEGCHFPTE
ncbi:MAG: hypothetical protein NZM37_01215 [Sandaracinaceae bacterium]|nr:hypothetical protein [Sandaracinaceae bacterium]MDW8246837.1 hypothetical protein [Sandaracinaceae bacterium]